ncbi:MAG: hypothetical protein H6765_07675 [Candidatus Peribacteria bacterium]|nr:MAG: hypothetical protein H6765_07675 [Candidatus Peribacteria bacterium]
MKKLQVQGVMMFGLWLVVTTIGFFGAAFGAKPELAPKSLDHQTLQHVTISLAHHNAEIWYVNGEPVLTQQTQAVAGYESALDLLDPSAVQTHLSQSMRSSMRKILKNVVVTPEMRRNQQVLLANAAVQAQSPLAATIPTKHRSPIQLLIDPKRYVLGVQSRWGVREAWSNRSSVVQLIHNALVKEESVRILA